MQSIVFRLEDWPKGMNSKPTQRLYSYLSGESPSVELFDESATVILADFGRCEIIPQIRCQSCHTNKEMHMYLVP
jgi:hypothetical protein